MDLWKATKYAALAVGLFVAVSVVLAVVSFLLELVWTLVTTAIGLLVLLGVGYALVKGLLWLRGGDGEPVDDVPTETTDPTERLADRYVEGDLDERELERRLELELDGPDRDDVDRELDRSRSG